MVAIRGIACVCGGNMRNGLCLWWRYEAWLVFVIAIRGMACVCGGDARHSFCLC